MVHKKCRVQKIIFVISIMMSLMISLHAETQNEVTDVELKVKEILSQYNAKSLNKEDALAIHEAFRDAGINGGLELDAMINSNGFSSELLRTLAPPPQAQNDRNKDKQASSGEIFSSLEKKYGPDNFALFSRAVENGELLSQFKCEKKINGVEKSIPLNWENVPEEAKSLAVVMYHYPHTDDHSHINSYLLLWGVDPAVNEIQYGKADKGDWFMGSNKDGNAISYTSPCSHSPGSHNYTIALFALSETPAELPGYSTADVDFSTFMSAVENTTIIGKAELNFVDKKE